MRVKLGNCLHQSNTKGLIALKKKKNPNLTCPVNFVQSTQLICMWVNAGLLGHKLGLALVLSSVLVHRCGIEVSGNVPATGDLYLPPSWQKPSNPG